MEQRVYVTQGKFAQAWEGHIRLIMSIVELLLTAGGLTAQ